MLNVMRKHAGSWMIKVILFAIVIVFVFWGVGSFRSREASKVATVNGEMISLTDYRRAYNNLIDQYRQRFGSSLNDGMIEMLRIKSQALDQLVDRTLLLQEAQKLDLRVSDTEVADSIMKTAVFQNDGVFDNRRYRRILAQVHLTPEEFEAEQKSVLLSEKLTRIVMGAAKVSEAEARQWYEWQNTSVDVEYVLFAPAEYADLNPTEEEVSAFFETRKETYKTDPMVKVRYVVFDPEEYQAQVAIDDEEIAEYYDSHMAEFKNEKMVEARHILFKLDQDADEKTSLAAKTRAEEVAKRAKSGEDFAELARTHSEGPTKDSGGYLGKFQQSQMVKPFADKAFSMTAGEVSDPVKTQFGWHVIKIESIEAASTQTLEESKGKIRAALAERKAQNLAYDKAEQFYEGCFEKDDLIKNAKSFEIGVLETDAFSRRGPESLGNAKGEFANAAFGLNVDDISDVQDIDGRYYLIQPMVTIDATIPELPEVKTKVAADLIKQMQTDKAKAEAEAMVADMDQGKEFEASAGEREAVVKQTGPFTRNAAIPDIGSDPKFSEAAFQLSSAGSSSQQLIQGNAGYYVLRLAERKTPPADGFAAQREDIDRMLLSQKQRVVIQDWIKARKADSQIVIEKAYLE